MFCVTFYSYKGGVGRTMALANVAMEHARNGKKVLVVDFDLEAPGLSTLTPFAQSMGEPGIIDFVSEYCSSGVVPDVKNFIYNCPVEGDGFESFNIDILPAGSGGDAYSEAYSSIEWASIYQENNGFLMMEDLRAQWKDAGYDYVYLDSRTGHTDIGGICTRQLPDAVAIVFFPNAQNLEGLRQTVPEIRNHSARGYEIETLFVASRVPRLDDEDGVLKRLLANFQETLEYSPNNLVVIEQYDSLKLLDQELFVLTRPRSGMARQLRKLAYQISMLNVEDADGAVAYLQKTLSALGRDDFVFDEVYSRPSNSIDFHKLSKIRDAHEHDSLILFLLAQVYHSQRALVEASRAIDRAIALGGVTAVKSGLPDRFDMNLHQLRIRVASELDQGDAVIESALFILRSEEADDFAIIDAMSSVANVDPKAVPDLDDLAALKNAPVERMISVVRRLGWSEATAELAAKLVERILQGSPRLENIRSEDITDLQIPLIAAGRFDLAYEIYQTVEEKDQLRLDVLFNSSMAKWGRDGNPDFDMLRDVSYVFHEETNVATEANHNQCWALVAGLLGDEHKMFECLETAREIIGSARHIEFSCWNYLNVSAGEFLVHLDAIEDFILHDGPGPQFLRVSS